MRHTSLTLAILLAAGLLATTAQPAQAGDFESGFRHELGAIGAHAVVGLGVALVTGDIGHHDASYAYSSGGYYPVYASRGYYGHGGHRSYGHGGHRSYGHGGHRSYGHGGYRSYGHRSYGHGGYRSYGRSYGHGGHSGGRHSSGHYSYGSHYRY